MGSSWKYDEEERAKELLREGKKYSEVAKILDRSIYSISLKNQRKWNIPYENPSALLSWNEVEKIYKEKGFILLEGQTYTGKGSKICAYDCEGYIICASPQNIKNGHPPLRFSTSNPYTLRNIKEVWLPNNAPEYELISNEYMGAAVDLIWKIKDSMLPSFAMPWARFQGGERHPLTARERIAATRRRKPEQVRKELEDIISKNEIYRGWKLSEGEEFKYKNSQTIMKFENENGYIAMRCLLQFQQKDIIPPFNINYIEASTNNIRVWLNNNTEYNLSEGESYKGNGENHWFECPRHGKFLANWDNILQGHGCKKCAIDNMTGENNPRWRFDLSDEERLIARTFSGYSSWRIGVYEKDNYTCVYCGDSQGGNLNAHHKDGYNWCEERRMDISNGVTLCEKCHCLDDSSFHKLYGYGDNTEEQFKEWLKSRRKIDYSRRL